MSVPCATYRLQLRAGFGFRQTRDLVPYLYALGITHLYLSPVLQARKGSSHCYDLVNPLSLNPELGSAEEFEAVAAAAASHGMGLLLDIVPNHMAASAENPWWLDVLENGPSSPYAGYFDIDWDPAHANIEDKVLLPILGARFGAVLESGELALSYRENGFWVNYFEHQLPVTPRSYAAILAHRLKDAFPPDSSDFQDLSRLIEALNRLPGPDSSGQAALVERYGDKERIKRELRQLYETRPKVSNFIDQNIRILNGERGDPRSFVLLEQLLDEQPYRLAFWKVAKEKINYRRFFDITDLVSLHSWEAEVFRATHALILRLVGERKASGVRVDHIDGLYDPGGYAQRLRDALPAETYIVVEKILAPDEVLPRQWPVAGTTGYDFLNAANALYADPAGLERVESTYRQLTGCDMSFEEVAYREKRRVMNDLFSGEMQGLAHYLVLLTEGDRHTRDLVPSEVSGALVEITAALPVYRTYITDKQVSERDQRYIERVAAEAARRNPALAESIEFIRRVLLLELEDKAEDCLRFAMRWQQFSGPITAKGVEDTALYSYSRLISLNEVGSGGGPRSVDEFHSFNQSRLAGWPLAMNASSTHDTKRSEDVRARIHAISEFPEEWDRRLKRWSRWNGANDRNLEVHIYQALLGAWPLEESEGSDFRDRMKGYAVKAAREAKTHTSWLRTDPDFEKAVEGFIDGILMPSDTNRFLADFQVFQRKIAPFGAWNALSQTLLKITAPGVPDFYQGTEIWDFSLVDPDNRRPVDFAVRKTLLEQLQKGISPAELLAHWEDGRVKLYLIWKALEFRRTHPELFAEGEYLPVVPSGERSDNVVAFARKRDQEWAVSVAPRLTVKFFTGKRPPLGRVWLDTTLPLTSGAPSAWHNVLTGAELNGADSLALREVMAEFPVALLHAVG